MIRVTIVPASARWKNAFPRMKQKIEKAVRAAVEGAHKPAFLKKKPLEVTLLLTTDARIRVLNRDWRGMDKPTNVLSFPQFPLSPPPASRAKARIHKGSPATVDQIAAFAGVTPVGDVILALQTIRREAKEQKKSIENHMIHLVVHGTLHLFGYDHIRAGDAKTMERLEVDILASLGYPDPYNEPATKNGRTPRNGRTG